MTQSIRRRPLILATALTAGTLAAGLLAGCGAGQITSTGAIVSAVPGSSGSVRVPGPDGGEIQVRNLTIDYPGPDGYPAGAPAPLSVRIFNGTAQQVTLVGVSAVIVPARGGGSTDAGTAVLVGSAPSGSPAASATGPVSIASAGPSAAGSASARPSASGSASARASGAPAPSGSAVPVGGASVDVPVPSSPGLPIVLSRAAGGRYLQIASLPRDVSPADTMRLTFTFRLADGSTAVIGTADSPLEVVVAPPTGALSRSPLPLETPAQ